MSAVTVPSAASYLEDGFSLWSWLSSVDHKRIAVLYAISITLFFFIGGAAATLIRLELVLGIAIRDSAARPCVELKHHHLLLRVHPGARHVCISCPRCLGPFVAGRPHACTAP